MPAISVISIALIIGGVTCKASPILHGTDATLLMAVAIAVISHSVLGFLGGYCLGKLMRYPEAQCRTLCISIGVQNSGLGAVIAGTFIATPAAISATPAIALCVLPPAIACATQSIVGTALASWFAHRDALQECQPA